MKFKLTITNSVTRLTDPEEDTAAFLKDALTNSYKVFEPRIRGYVFKEWSLYNERMHAFPVGVTGLVRKAIVSEGHELELVDTRVLPAIPDMTALDRLKVPLRDYQREAVEVLLKRPCGILQAATASGKGNVAVGLVACLPQVKWLILINRETLLKQIVDRFAAVAGDTLAVGTVTADKWSPSDVTVATFSGILTQSKKMPGVKAWLQSVQAVLCDETHTSAASTFAAVVSACVGAPYRYGMSGTPLDRSDHKALMVVGLFGPIVHRISAGELIESGHVSKPNIRMVRFTQQYGFAQKWAAIYRHQICDNKHRNQLIVEVIKKADKPCIVFAERIEHIRELVQRCVRAGMSTEHFDGTMQYAARDRLIADVKLGRVDVLVASVAGQEGMDIPCLASVVLAGAGKGVIGTVQKLGRGMRIAPGKDAYDVYDVHDIGGALERQAQKRKKTYEAEGHDVTILSWQELNKELSDGAGNETRPADA